MKVDQVTRPATDRAASVSIHGRPGFRQIVGGPADCAPGAGPGQPAGRAAATIVRASSMRAVRTCVP